MLRTKRRLLLFLGTGMVLVLLFLGGMAWLQPPTAHSAQTGEPPDADAAAAFAKAGCAGCHTIPGVANAVGQVGPDLSAIGSEADTRKDSLDAEAYLHESIVDPQAFIAPQCPNGDCPENVMLPNIAERLTDDEISSIVDYLIALKGDGVADVPLFELVPIEVVRPAETETEPFAEPPKTYDDAQVLIGKYLFFDPRLSGDATQSCASCHQPELAYTDGEALNRGYTGTGYFRNAPTVMNTVFNDGYLYWDGRLDALDMPTTVRDHITEAHFMNSDGRLMVERVKQVPEYVQLFEEAYGSGPSFGKVLGSLTAYVHSLNSGVSPYDAYVAGDDDALSEDAIAGLALFEDNCASCHSGPIFTDNEFYNIGVPENGEIWADPLRHITFRRFFRQLGVPNYRALTADAGLFAVTKDDDDFGAFRTAPLREVAQTAPYMHNGVFDTLDTVVEFYNDSLDLDLSSAEMAELVAFLESLSSDLPEVEPTEQPAYQLRPLGDNR